MKKLVYIFTALAVLVSCTDDVIAPDTVCASTYQCLLTNSNLTFNYKQPGSNYNYDVQAIINGFTPTGGGITVFDEDGSDLVYFTIRNNNDDGSFQDVVAFEISQSSCADYRSYIFCDGRKIDVYEGGTVTITGLGSLVDGEHTFTRFNFTEKNPSGTGFSLLLRNIDINGKLCTLNITQNN